MRGRLALVIGIPPDATGVDDLGNQYRRLDMQRGNERGPRGKSGTPRLSLGGHPTRIG